MSEAPYQIVVTWNRETFFGIIYGIFIDGFFRVPFFSPLISFAIDIIVVQFLSFSMKEVFLRMWTFCFNLYRNEVYILWIKRERKKIAKHKVLHAQLLSTAWSLISWYYFMWYVYRGILQADKHEKIFTACLLRYISENVATVIINDASTTLFTFIEFFYFFNPNDTGLIIYKSKTFHWSCMEADMIELPWCPDCTQSINACVAIIPIECSSD